MAFEIQHSIRTLRLRVRAEGYAWLNEAAIEVNRGEVAPVRQRDRIIALSRGAEPDL